MKKYANYTPNRTPVIGYGGFKTKDLSAQDARSLAAVGHLVPILVALDDAYDPTTKSRNHNYGFGTKINDTSDYAKSYRALFGESQSLFHSGSKATEAVKKILEPDDKGYGEHAGDAGTIVHKIAEMLGNKEISLSGLKNLDVLKKMKKTFREQNLETYKVFKKDGSLTDAASKALNKIGERLTKEKSVLREQSLGGLANINGVEEAIVATIDNLVEDKDEYIVKDYKFRHGASVAAFTEIAQLAQEKALLEANRAELGLNSQKAINKGQILHYNSQTGEESVREYNLGTTEEYLKFVELTRKLSAGEIEISQYVAQLPPMYKKAYADQYGPVGKWGNSQGIEVR